MAGTREGLALASELRMAAFVFSHNLCDELRCGESLAQLVLNDLLCSGQRFNGLLQVTSFAMQCNDLCHGQGLCCTLISSETQVVLC